MLEFWQVHVSFVLKSLKDSQTANNFSRARAFLARLGETLLLRCGDVPGYLLLATLTDTFRFETLIEHSKTNLMQIDLRVNYLITLLTKLSLMHSSDKTEKNIRTANLVTCAFYRAVCFA